RAVEYTYARPDSPRLRNRHFCPAISPRKTRMTTLVESPFSQIEQAPPDPILGLTEAFNADPNPNKVNLGVGVYQDGSGKVPVLHVVREAEERWLAREDSKSYLPIDGAPAYNRQVQELLFGAGSPVLADG